MPIKSLGTAAPKKAGGGGLKKLAPPPGFTGKPRSGTQLQTDLLGGVDSNINSKPPQLDIFGQINTPSSSIEALLNSGGT